MLDSGSAWQRHWRLAVEFEDFTAEEQAEVLTVLNRDVAPHKFFPEELSGNCDANFTISKVKGLQPYGPGDEPPQGSAPEVGIIAVARSISLGQDIRRDWDSDTPRIEREVENAVNSWWYRRPGVR